MEPYQPVSRDFYEEVEFSVAQKKNCELTYYAENGAVSRVMGRLYKLYTKEEIEYLTLDNGLEIPLHNIISFNGKRPQSFC